MMEDKTTTLGQLKIKVDRFRRARNWNPNVKNLAVSIAIEASELLEHFQWDNYEEYRSDKKREDIEQELADVLIYCLEFANGYGINMAKAVEKKLAHNARKYPAHIFKSKTSGGAYYKIKKKYRERKK